MNVKRRRKPFRRTILAKKNFANDNSFLEKLQEMSINNPNTLIASLEFKESDQDTKQENEIPLVNEDESRMTIEGNNHFPSLLTIYPEPGKERNSHSPDRDEIMLQHESQERVKSEVERFIEISKYFSGPLRRTASYMCESCLVTYANPLRIEYKRGCVTTQHIKFSNVILEPVYIRIYKLIPNLEQVKFINMTLSQSKRIPPGLSFTLGFVYDDVEGKPCSNSKLIVVAHRKTETPCYQLCEIDLLIEPQKKRIRV